MLNHIKCIVFGGCGRNYAPLVRCVGDFLFLCSLLGVCVSEPKRVKGENDESFQVPG